MIDRDWRTLLKRLPNEARLRLLVIYREVHCLKASFAEGELTKEQFGYVRDILQDIMPDEPL